MTKSSLSLSVTADPGSYLRPKDAAKFVGLSKNTLCTLRSKCKGPKYSRQGARVIVYKVADLQAWHERQQISTS